MTKEEKRERRRMREFLMKTTYLRIMHAVSAELKRDPAQSDEEIAAAIGIDAHRVTVAKHNIKYFDRKRRAEAAYDAIMSEQRL